MTCSRAAGELVGPESFDAGPVINSTDLPGLATSARSAEEMEEVVRAQVDAGADWIKLYTGLSPELLKAGIDAAHRHGRPAVAHLERIGWPDKFVEHGSSVEILRATYGLAPDDIYQRVSARWRSLQAGQKATADI